MTEDQRQEREDWEELLTSRGWSRLCAHVVWNYTSGDAFKRRVTGNVNGGVDAKEGVPQALAVTTAFETLLGHPRNRLDALNAMATREAQPQPLRRT